MKKIKREIKTGPGRPKHGEETKIHKSIRIEPYLIRTIQDDFPSFSKGIELLIKDYIASKKDMKMRK